MDEMDGQTGGRSDDAKTISSEGIKTGNLKANTLEDFENASPYFCTFLTDRICD